MAISPSAAASTSPTTTTARSTISPPLTGFFQGTIALAGGDPPRPKSTAQRGLRTGRRSPRAPSTATNSTRRWCGCRQRSGDRLRARRPGSPSTGPAISTSTTGPMSPSTTPRSNRARHRRRKSASAASSTPTASPSTPQPATRSTSPTPPTGHGQGLRTSGQLDQPVSVDRQAVTTDGFRSLVDAALAVDQPPKAGHLLVVDNLEPGAEDTRRPPSTSSTPHATAPSASCRLAPRG